MDYVSVTEELPFQDLHGIKTCAGAGEQQFGVSSQKNGEESYAVSLSDCRSIWGDFRSSMA
jgi:hypothetical protein